MNTWEIKQLRHFKVIYELSSISQAAAHLGLTQSALTKSLKKLEEHLGLELFHRHTRELQATDAAKALYHNVLEVLASAQDLTHKVSQISEGNLGKVKVACGPLIQQLIGEQLVSQAIVKLPKTNLQISSGTFQNLAYGLLNHEYDFMMYDAGDVQGLNEPERFEVTPLIQMPIVFVVSPEHPLFKSGATPFEFKWALPSIPIRFKTELPEHIYSQFLQAGIPHYQMESMANCINLAKRKLVMTAALKVSVQSELDRGELIALNIPLKPVANFGLYRLRSRKLSQQAISVINLIQSIIRNEFESNEKRVSDYHR